MRDSISCKILFVSEMFWPYLGGAEISALNVLSNLTKKGLEVSVLTHRFPGTKPNELRNNVAITREEFFSEHRLLFYIRAILAILKNIVRSKPQVILAQQLISPPVIALSKVFHIPIIVVVHDYWPICHNRTLLKPNRQVCCSYDTKLGEIYACTKNSAGDKGPRRTVNPLIAAQKSILVYFHALIVKYLMGKADVLVANSLFVKRVLAASGFDRSKIKVVYPPVQVGNETRAVTRDASTILYVGRLDFEKGLDYLLKAIQLVRMRTRIKLAIVGKGRQESSLRFLAKNLGIEDSIEFLGLVSSKNMEYLYRSSGAVAVPSVWPEPFGRVVIEAMMHAAPVVAFNVGGISEVLQPQSGILVPPKNIKALADALTQACRVKSNLAGLDKFRHDEIAASMFSIIKNTTKTSSK